MKYATITLHVKVTEPAALWRKAREYLATEPGAYPPGEDVSRLIGTEHAPDIGGCLQMLLDRSEHLDGAEIQESECEEADDGEG